jgi:hypothetical protein
MAQHMRKTRTQKIQAAERRERLVDQSSALTTSLTSSTFPTDTPGTLPAADTAYAYVGHDLRRISVITAGCFLLLGLATVLLSDFSWMTQLRQILRLPSW